MELIPKRIFAYIKTALPVDTRTDSDPGAALIAKPFVGSLNIVLAHDAGDRFALLQRRHLTDLGMNEDELFALGIANLQSFVDSSAVQVQKQGAVYAVMAGGNFEASLLLIDSFWKWMCGHVGTETLFARVPARDLLIVAPGTDEGRAEFDLVMGRLSKVRLDHVLSNELLLWNGSAWSVHP